MQIKEINSDISSKLKRIKMLELLSPEEIEEIAKVIEIVEYNSNEVIVAEGEISSYLYAVLDGSVRVTVKQTDEEGVIKDVYICTIGKSETFGEAAVFMNVERTADVFANDPVITMRIDRENLIRFIKSHPGAGIKILMIIIFSLLNKLKEANRELAFERKTVLAQNDIDALISDLMGTGS
ncbi:MAG: hypothetical protein A2015_15850 [Spirochaetes bacterium GWF1_31_7]|nr:MAG: hypothetical protein A2Y30_13225 [Spirochaetes bacterium GWE1_32_154]OHD49927.1 MAG: hypothetical protein A2Y29_11270 [Spirochaetes bacterium GWE2_31_10]OHD52245.1 MAG: hypothetical protein A2015_15850 [Spirochaetes bacterium GWF1_31_7]OHD82285.1 MAG: hypothetical protein A2355_00850 [Spirochaetes bacterium RIFOXYB1_FULL_32_8]HBD92616.1 hypothetical protein [Spirochaetia bacterium]